MTTIAEIKFVENDPAVLFMMNPHLIVWEGNVFKTVHADLRVRGVVTVKTI